MDEEGGGDVEFANLSDAVVTLLSKAQNERNTAQRLIALRSAKRIIVHDEPTLLDNFLDEMLAFMNDPSPDVRRFVAEFIEEACLKEMDILPTVLPNLSYLYASDHHVAVQKRIILAAAHVYPNVLTWVCKQKTGPPQMQHCWEQFTLIKHKIRDMLDTDNDGVRNYTIKFYEMCILCQTPVSEKSESVGPAGFNIRQVPRDHRFVSFKQLEGEAKTMLKSLLELIASPAISSLNLMTCMASLVTIARARPDNLFEKLVLAFETLHVNLPPTLAKSQVVSVRKALKLHLFSLLRHAASGPVQPQITTLLTDLGASQAQIVKALPAESEMRQRMRSKNGRSMDKDERLSSKRQKLEKAAAEASDEDEEEEESAEAKENKLQQQAIETTSVFLYEKLTADNVADLVMLALVVLPPEPPAAFQSSYTPIAAAGTTAQKRHLARMMAAQFTAAGVGPGATLLRSAAQPKPSTSGASRRTTSKPSRSSAAVPTTTSSGGGGGGGQAATAIDPATGMTQGQELALANIQMDMIEQKLAHKQQPQQPVLGTQSGGGSGVRGPSKRLHQKGLLHITQPLEPDQRDAMLSAAYTRILQAERRALQGGAHGAQQQILARLIARLQMDAFSRTLRQYILADQKNRADLAVLWLWEHYATHLNLTRGFVTEESESFDRYDLCFCRLLNDLFKKGEHRESLFHKLLLEAPLITPNAIVILKQACLDSVYGQFAMNTLREMILTRPRQRAELLSALLDFVVYENADVRRAALNSAKELYTLPYMQADVKEFAMRNARFVCEPSPPAMLFGADKGRLEALDKWDELSVKSCVRLLLHLLPIDASLMHSLAEVYVKAHAAEIRLHLTRMLEAPMKAIGMQSPEVLRLIETYPDGAEALVIKVLQLLTERNAPTRELVEQVCQMHRVRMPDVRILVPVITGLTRAEISSALPKLIKLSANVVREVFNKLLVAKAIGLPAPLQPAELMVALHQLPPATTDVKAVMWASIIMNFLDDSPADHRLPDSIEDAAFIYDEFVPGWDRVVPTEVVEPQETLTSQGEAQAEDEEQERVDPTEAVEPQEAQAMEVESQTTPQSQQHQTGGHISDFVTVDEVRREHARPFRTQRRYYDVEFRNTDQIDDIHTFLIEAIRYVMQRVLDGADPGDRVGVEIRHPGLNTQIVIPLMPRDRLDAETILRHVESIEQSESNTFAIDDQMHWIVSLVKVPAGSGRAKPNYPDLDEWLQHKKQTTVTIKNTDHMCLVRALVVAKAHCDWKQRNLTGAEAKYNTIRQDESNRYKQQKIQAQALLVEAGLAVPTQAMPLDAIKQLYQTPTLRDYRIQIPGSKKRQLVQTSTCTQVKLCKCGVIVRDKREHECGKSKCHICKEMVEQPHYCYMQVIGNNANGPKNKHVPNLICATRVTTSNGKQEHIKFDGDGCVAKFCRWLFARPNRGAVAIAHNAKAVGELMKMKQLYTKEVMADVIQKLLDAERLPALFMRTVIQVLQLFSTLRGFVINVLQRLIVRRVWEQPQLWEGFVRCCLRCRPESYQVLLSLPPEQLRLVFTDNVGRQLRHNLLQHLEQLPVNQQQLIPYAIMHLVRQDPAEYSGQKKQAAAAAAPVVVVVDDHSQSADVEMVEPAVAAANPPSSEPEPPCVQVVNIPEGTDETSSSETPPTTAAAE